MLSSEPDLLRGALVDVDRWLRFIRAVQCFESIDQSVLSAVISVSNAAGGETRNSNVLENATDTAN